jgi:hypothetical protein
VPFVETVPEEEAVGATAEMYATDRETFGFLPNFTQGFSLRPSYCSLAHGSVLLSEFLDADSVTAAVKDHHAAGLTETEVAVMDLAAKVADDATAVEQADIDRLRSAGLSDAEIVDVVLAAAARCFFSKTLDALGVQPDAKYGQLDAGVRDALTVGRPIATA